MIAWTRSSAVLVLKYRISLTPHLTTISRVSSSVTYTQYLVHLYLSTISCIYSLFYLLYLTISCGLILLPTRSPLPPSLFNPISCVYRHILYSILCTRDNMGISCMLWNNSALYLVSTQYLVVCSEYLLYLGFLS